MHHGKPQPRFVRESFGSVEWLKNAIQGLSVHANSCVRNRELHIISWLCSRGRRQMAFAEVVCSYAQFASFGHGIPRIQGQIHQKLPYLAGICPTVFTPSHKSSSISIILGKVRSNNFLTCSTSRLRLTGAKFISDFRLKASKLLTSSAPL